MSAQRLALAVWYVSGYAPSLRVKNDLTALHRRCATEPLPTLLADATRLAAEFPPGRDREALLVVIRELAPSSVEPHVAL